MEQKLMQQDTGMFGLTPSDSWKMHSIEQLFRCISIGEHPQQRLASYSFETVFSFSVACAKSLCWKHCPDAIKTEIRKLYENRKKDLKKIADTPGLSEENKLINSEKIVVTVAKQVLEVLLTAMSFSSVSSETIMGDVFKDIVPYQKAAQSEDVISPFIEDVYVE